ncbi:MAG: Hpt domain-containing protein [Candidatus Omnitrophica bacterium]|nr:Hpt domain-containing protein [Candidatus Omnitrophota bacterium]
MPLDKAKLQLMFQNEAMNRLETLKRDWALLAEDFGNTEALESALGELHTLKGTALMLEAKEIADKCESLELELKPVAKDGPGDVDALLEKARASTIEIEQLVHALNLG